MMIELKQLLLFNLYFVFHLKFFDQHGYNNIKYYCNNFSVSTQVKDDCMTVRKQQKSLLFITPLLAGYKC